MKEKFSSDKATKDYIKSELVSEGIINNELNKDLEDHTEARVITQIVAEQTQKTIEDNFNTLVTSAIQAVFSEKLEFKIKFVQKRNKTECECYIINDGNECGMFDGGFGVAEIASFGCRVAFLHLEKKARKIMFLDEPTGSLNGNIEQENFSNVMQMLSDKYEIQFIVVTNQGNIVGDRIFNVKNGECKQIS
ncbi:MAG: hypothetical protein GQ540_03825 [Lutibacter sp.]|uniref:hypothetical protein n=1 Tax=Lutibacter sp. TaxID=1925666 RepID=UPI001A0CC78F|nr:hypothetical protein [Lutibacter sp.]NOR27642.1 hypothetical protein [Lutibacter sp.]